MLIQTAFEDERLFIEIFEPYEFEDFIATAAEEFNIDNPEDIIVTVNGTKVKSTQFKAVVMQYFKVPTFHIDLTVKEFERCASSAGSSTTGATVYVPGLSSYVDPTKYWLPGVEEIKAIKTVEMYLNNYLRGEPLRNKDRVKIAKAIIDECIKDNPNRFLHRDDFQKLSKAIVTIFENEVESTYYMPFTQGVHARGKLMNAYNNKRNSLSVNGVIQRRSRPSLKRKATLSPTPMNEEEPEGLQVLQENTSDWPSVLSKWYDTHHFRLHALKLNILTPKEYLTKYVALREPKGIELVSLDVHKLHPSMSNVGNWLNLYPKVIKQARPVRDKNVVQILEDIDKSQDEKLRAQLALICIAYILPHCGKRSEAKDKGNASKSEIQERFMKEYKTFKELHNSPQPAELQIRFVRDETITYADFTIAGHTFQCCDLMEALNTGFMYTRALGVDYPRICTHVWQFVQLAIFQIPLSLFKAPSVETVYNDLLNDV